MSGTPRVVDRAPIRAAALLVPLLACVAPPATCARDDSTEARAAKPASRYFGVQVLDDATGRGVPLVELETVNSIVYVTDSAGRVAIEEPGLMGREVWFTVRSHGYEHAADGFGNRGFRCDVVEGEVHTVRIARINIAERLYRVTGQGIYRDTVLLGLEPPLEDPVLAGGVLGQDSVQNAIYGGRLFWVWGDTSRAKYPLGNFASSAAVSKLPEVGGLSPEVGVDLDYWVDDEGFSRRMCPIEGPGPVWIHGLFVFEEDGREHMVGHYGRMKNLGERLEHGIVRWSDETETFQVIERFPDDVPVHPVGHPILVDEEGETFVYFPDPYPATRVRARIEHVRDPKRYEAYTCLEDGARWDAEEPKLDRNDAGELIWRWRADTAGITPARWKQLVVAGHVEFEEGWMLVRDVETNAPLQLIRGSVFRNEYRDRWIMIANESGGRSMLGEIWYAEAAELLGPWTRARRIVTHDDYSFYNVKQHPYFDQDGGRFVYFEGTYTASFSGAKVETPRYDYNQVMYRLDLADDRLRPGDESDGAEETEER